MAAKKITTEKRVKYRLPRLPGANADQDQYVALNGKAYIIKRGTEVEIPEAVAEILKHSEYAEDIAAIYAESQAFKE
jgi:hypothetical protein